MLWLLPHPLYYEIEAVASKMTAASQKAAFFKASALKKNLDNAMWNFID
jgi:hypothetical protein